MGNVYILKCSDGSLYTGKTTDIEKRLKSHNGNARGGAKYTSGRRPVTLVYSESFNTVKEALGREAEIKRLRRIEKLKLIKQINY